MRIRCAAAQLRPPCFAAMVIAAVVVAWTRLLAQAPAERFEVTSVRRTLESKDGVTVQFLPNGRFMAMNISLRDLIGTAYGTPRPVPANRIIGGPDWIAAERYDIEAVAAGPLPTDPAFDGLPRRMFGMVQSLLAERFQLKLRLETPDTPVYVLVVAKSDGSLGPRLRRSESGCAAARAARAGGAGSTTGAKPSCDLRFTRGVISAQGVPLAEIIRNALSRYVDRIVLDETGLAGEYDLDLTWSPEALTAAPADAAAAPTAGGTSLFTAVQEQLGLKLDSRRAPVEILVVERAERPTPN